MAAIITRLKYSAQLMLPLLLALPLQGFAAGIPIAADLRLWLDASTISPAPDGTAVNIWEDGSGNNNHATFNPANAYGEQAPSFQNSNSLINGKPAVVFSGSNALELNLSWLSGSDYTIFVVGSRDRYGLANFYIAGDSAVTNSNLVLGYENESSLRHSHFNNDLDASVSTYTGSPLWSRDTFVFSQVEGKDIYQNGTLIATDDSLAPLSSTSGSTLGHFRTFGNTYWFQGALAEILIYDRALNIFEKESVEGFLDEKYSSVSPVPLPAAGYLFLTGLAGLLGSRRIGRRRFHVKSPQE